MAGFGKGEKWGNWPHPAKWFGGMAIAQLVALAWAATGLLSGHLKGFGVPILEVTCAFLLLAILHGGTLRFFSSTQSDKSKWHIYAAIGFLLMSGLCLTILGLRYSIFQCWTLLMQADTVLLVPLSFTVLKARYKTGHYVSIVFGMLGLMLFVLFSGGDMGLGEKKASVGSMLTLCGALVTGGASVWMESVLRNGANRHEVLSVVGMFGSFHGLFLSLCMGEDPRTMFDAARDMNVAKVGVIVLVAFMYGSLSFSLPWCGVLANKLSMFTSNIWLIVVQTGVGGFSGFLPGFVASLVCLTLSQIVFLVVGDPYDVVPESGLIATDSDQLAESLL